MKPNFTKANYLFLLFSLLLLYNNFTFAQGDPWGENQTSIFEESDLYIDAYTNKSRSIYQDPAVSAGGYLGIGVSTGNAPANPDPKGTATVPFPGCPDPDIACPIDSEIVFLIFAGLFYGAYKSRRKFTAII